MAARACADGGSCCARAAASRSALVELGPAHLRDLVAARAGEHQYPQRLPEWLAVLASEPQPAQLGVGEGALAYLLLVRLLDPGDRRERKHIARDQPVEELRQRPERAVRQIAAAADSHTLDQIDHVALADAGDRATAPSRQDDAIEHPFGRPSGRGTGLAVGVQLQERGRRRLDVVPAPVCFGRYSRCRRYIRADLKPVAMGRSRGARGGEREAAIAGATKRLLAVDAVVAEAHRPRARAGRLNDQIETGTAGVRIFGARRLRPNGLDEAVGDNFSHHCILARGVKG